MSAERDNLFLSLIIIMQIILALGLISVAVILKLQLEIDRQIIRSLDILIENCEAEQDPSTLVLHRAGELWPKE